MPTALFIVDWLSADGSPDVPQDPGGGGCGFVCKSYVPDTTVIVWVQGTPAQINAMRADADRYLYLGDIEPIGMVRKPIKLRSHERNQVRVRGWLIAHGRKASDVNKIGWSGADPEALLAAVASVHRRDPGGRQLQRQDLD